jgi:hypothetical protein
MRLNKTFPALLGSAAALLMLAGCQKMERPAMGDYPQDSNPPGGPLKFYVAFDGTTTNPLMNAVDSIRASFASDNPLTTVDGISGKAIQGTNMKYVKYAKPNDWATTAQSFTISVWYKKDGQTKNNKGGNGPEYLFSLKQTNVSGANHWSGSILLFFLEGNNTACAVKTMFADKNNADSWSTWEGGNSIPGLCDNKWHHLAVVYNHTNSQAILYVDGVANPNVRGWPGHGPINFDNNRILEMRVGAGPAAANTDTDDWLAGTFKGGIDQFRLYGTALSAADVAALYNGKK